MESVLAEVTERGPLRASELDVVDAAQGRLVGLERCEARPRVPLLGRPGHDEHAKELRARLRSHRARPAAGDHRAPTPPLDDAHRELVRISSRALGIATDDDLADYFRLRLGDVRPRIHELVEERALTPVRIEGIAKPAYLAAGAKLPRTATGRALLSPFDPLVWHRARTHRLFEFHYRIEIYTPEHLRKHGYYVLPFLDGDALAARVDLKAARDASTLLVQAAHLEPGAEATQTAASLALELRDLATWLGLERIQVTRKGSLAKALAASLRASSHAREQARRARGRHVVAAHRDVHQEADAHHDREHARAAVPRTAAASRRRRAGCP